MRGRLVSRPAAHVMREAERLVEAGVKELLVISQDTSAYGVDSKHAESTWKGRPVPARITDLCRGAGHARRLGAAALRLPLPARRRPDPADGRGPGPALSRHPLPARHPAVLKAMGRPAHQAKTLDGSPAGARSAPTSRCARPSSSASPARPRTSSRSCSTGWTRRSSTASAASSTRTSTAPPPTTCRRRCPRRSSRSAGTASWPPSRRSAARLLAAKVGRAIDVIVDEVDDEGAIGRSNGTRPRSTARYSSTAHRGLAPGDIVTATVDARRRVRPLGGVLENRPLARHIWADIMRTIG